MGRGTKYSDRVWCTLLWEFIRYTSEQLDNQSIVTNATARLAEAGIKTSSEMMELASPEIRQAIKLIAPDLFLGFLQLNPSILADEDLVEWVEEKQANYPL